MKDHIQLLYSEGVIASRIEKLAEELNEKYKHNKMVHVVVTLNGSFMFVADLIRKLEFPLTLCFAGSVTNNVKPVENTRINLDALPKSFGHEPVLVIEDIIDSGKTIKVLREMVVERFASSIDVIAFVKRQGCLVAPDYSCFTVPEGMFLVGYGMDLEGRYRELPGLYTLGLMNNKASGNC